MPYVCIVNNVFHICSTIIFIVGVRGVMAFAGSDGDSLIGSHLWLPSRFFDIVSKVSNILWLCLFWVFKIWWNLSKCVLSMCFCQVCLCLEMVLSLFSLLLHVRQQQKKTASVWLLVTRSRYVPYEIIYEIFIPSISSKYWCCLLRVNDEEHAPWSGVHARV